MAGAARKAGLDRFERGGLDAGLDGKGAPHEPGTVGEGQDGTQDHADQDHRPPRAGGGVGAVVHKGFEDRFLRDEARQRRNARHRRGADGGHDGKGAGGTVDARELADVTRSGLVVDDAHHEEERGLEQSVGEEQGQAGQRRIGFAEPHHHGQEAELADRAVGQDELDVRLPQRPVAADQHRGQAEAEHHRQPERGLRESRRQPCHEVDAGLHHGRGVQVGAHRGRGRHGAGEPEVERDERRFGDRADQDEHDGGVHGSRGGPGGEGGGQLQDRRDPVGPGVEAEDDQAHQHGQAAGGGHDEGLQGRAPRREPGPGVADQQVGQDRGQFPEDEHQEQVIGRHQAEHHPGEGQQLGAESAEVVVLVLEVPGAVDQDQRPHAEDQQGHDPGQGVHPEGKLNLQLRDPGQNLGRDRCRRPEYTAPCCRSSQTNEPAGTAARA